MLRGIFIDGIPVFLFPCFCSLSIPVHATGSKTEKYNNQRMSDSQFLFSWAQYGEAFLHIWDK